MLSYIIKRFLYVVPIVFGVMLITFILFNIVRGDITNQLAGQYASGTLLVASNAGGAPQVIFSGRTVS